MPQPTAYSFSRQNGYSSVITEDFAGANAQSDAYNFCIGYVSYCESFDVQPTGGGCYRATVKFNAIGGTSSDNPNQPLNNVWELQPNIVEKDLMEADLTAVNALTMADKQSVRQSVDSYVAGSAAPTFSTGSDPATMVKLWKLMTHGVKSIRVFAPTLRHTLITRPDYAVTQSIANCGNVIIDLAATESVPSTLIFAVPAGGIVRTLDSITLKTGWYKKFPTVSQVAGGKWQITQEWEYGLWSTDLYTFV